MAQHLRLAVSLGTGPSTQYCDVERSSMWLPQGGALKIENLQFTQYSIIMLARSYTVSGQAQRHTEQQGILSL